MRVYFEWISGYSVGKLRKKAKNSRAAGGTTRPKPPSQRTLYDYIAKEEPPKKSSSVSQEASTSCPLTPGEDDEEKFFETARNNILELVRSHQLNELTNLFRMRDRLRFSNANLKRLYFFMQSEVVREFGAPLSPSLFPEELFEALDSQPSLDVNFEC